MRRCAYEYYRNDDRRRYNNYKRNVKRERVFRDNRVHRALNPIKGFNVLLGIMATIFLAIMALDYVIGNSIPFIWILIAVVTLVAFVKILKK